MLPVSSPATEVFTNNRDGDGSRYRVVTRWRQRRPYDLCLPYKLRNRLTTQAVWTSRPEEVNPISPFGGYADAAASGSGFPRPPYSAMLDWDSPEVETLINKANAKFSASISESAQNLVSVIQGRRSVEMLARRGSEFLRLARAINRFNVPGVIEVLRDMTGSESGTYGIRRQIPTRVSRVMRKGKRPADIWLELHFGWEMAKKDVESSIALLESDFGPRLIKESKAKGWRVVTPHNSGLVYALPFGRGRQYGTTSDHYRIRAELGAMVRIDNPNLYLSQRMGLVNPLTVVNELIPFSFVADWFSNWSQWLGRFSEYLGLEISQSYHNLKVRKQTTLVDSTLFEHESSPGVWSQKDFISRTISIEDALFERKLGLPAVTLDFQMPDRMSLVRGATAISLLIQQVKSTRRELNRPTFIRDNPG